MKSISFVLFFLLLPMATAWALVFPADTPAGEIAGGKFTQYFQNAVNNPCPANSYVVGFSWGTTTYMRPDCVVVSIPSMSATGIIGGTQGYITKFGTWGNWLYNSELFSTGGNIGIGTTSPTAKFQVSGNVTITNGYLDYRPNGIACANGEYLSYSAFLARWQCTRVVIPSLTATGITGGTEWYITKFGTGGNGLYNSELFSTGGNIGIGTTTPTAKFQVSGNTYITNGYLDYRPNGIACASGEILAYNLASARWQCASPSASSLSSTGITGGTEWYITKFGTWGTGIYSSELFSTGGNIGIGTTTPTAKFQVSGNTYITNGYLDYRPNGVRCSDTQILSYNSGSSRWQCSSYSPGVTGTGTPNSMAKWTLSGTTLVLTWSSEVFETWGYVGIGTNTPTAQLSIDSWVSGISGLRLTSLPVTTPLSATSKPLGITSSGDVVLTSAGNISVYTSSSSQATQDLINYRLPLSYNQYFISGQQQTFTTTDVSAFPQYAPNIALSTSSNSVCNGVGAWVSASCVQSPWANFSSSAYNINTTWASYAYQLVMSDRVDTPLFFRGGRLKNWNSTMSCTSTSTCNLTGGIWNSDGSRVAGWFAVLSVPANRTDYFYVNPGVDVNNNIIAGGGNIGIGTATPMNRVDVYETTSTWRVMRLKRGTQGSDGSMINAYGSPYLLVGWNEYRTNSLQTIGFGYNNSASAFQPAEIGFLTTNTSGNTLWDIVFANRNGTSNVAPTEVMRITSAGNVGIAQNTPGATLDVGGDFKLGANGTVMTDIIKAAVVSNVSSISASSNLNVTMNVPNAQITGAVTVSPGTALANGLVIAWAHVSSANTVEIGFRNTTASPIDPPSMTYYLTVIN